MTGLGQPSDEYRARAVPASAGRCVLHSYHSPRPDELHYHHIHPLGMGGKDEAANRILVCPTGHANIHRLIRIYVTAGRKPRWETLRNFSPIERHLAAEAWRLSRD